MIILAAVVAVTLSGHLFKHVTVPKKNWCFICFVCVCVFMFNVILFTYSFIYVHFFVMIFEV